MNDERMAQLLREVDAAMVVAAGDAGEMAGRVRRLARKRQRQRMVAVSSIGVMAALLGVWLMPEPAARPAVASDAEYAALVDEADAKVALAVQLRAIDALAERSAALSVTDPTTLVEQGCDRTAMLLVADGDRKRRRSEPGAEACYRSVVELFPSSYWAGIARQRLRGSEG